MDLLVPDHTTFSGRSANLEVASALARTDGPVTVVIDFIGPKVFGKGEWHLEKYGNQARRTWRKLHLAVNPDTDEILASALASPPPPPVPLPDNLAALYRERIADLAATLEDPDHRIEARDRLRPLIERVAVRFSTAPVPAASRSSWWAIWWRCSAPG